MRFLLLQECKHFQPASLVVRDSLGGGDIFMPSGLKLWDKFGKCGQNHAWLKATHEKKLNAGIGCIAFTLKIGAQRN